MASFERFDGEMIVVKSDEAVMRVLNPVGAFIFERLDGRMNLNDLSLQNEVFCTVGDGFINRYTLICEHFSKDICA